MIKTLEIMNFKSIKHLAMNCKRINVFIGKPNTGKSNILESIGLLSHIYYGSLKEFVRLENMANIFYDGDVSENVVIKIKTNTHLGILKVIFQENRFKGIYVKKDRNEAKAYTVFGYDYSIKMEEITRLVDFRDFKFYRFKVKDFFPAKESVSLKPPSGDNLLYILIINKKIRKLVKDILSEFGLRIVLKPIEGKIEVEKEYEDIVISYPYSLVSDTLQRIIFHLVAIESNENSVIAFEEPEAHSFPYYTKFLAERIAYDTSNQYFISTHNPYFLLSILEKAPKDDVAIFITYYEDYQTKIKELSKEEKERILDLELDVFFNIDDFIK